MHIFNYESKFMQMLLHLADLAILNVLYVICCAPIFTIGAAQAGLYAAIRVLNDPENDSSAAKAFFKGFAGGFGKVTLAWGLLGLVIAGLVYFGYIAIYLGSPLWPIGVALGFVAWFQTMIPPLHCWFDCTAIQLIRNAWRFSLAHPLRSLGAAALLWFPFILFMSQWSFYFMALGMLWLTLYYSISTSFSVSLLKKPLDNLAKRFKEPATEDAQEENQEEMAAIEQ